MAQRNQKGKSVDGTETVNTHHLVMSELFEPEDADSQHTSDETKALLQQLAGGSLDGMVNSPLREHLESQDGKFSAPCSRFYFSPGCA